MYFFFLYCISPYHVCYFSKLFKILEEQLIYTLQNESCGNHSHDYYGFGIGENLSCLDQILLIIQVETYSPHSNISQKNKKSILNHNLQLLVGQMIATFRNG
jgi:hypothetical protein